MYIYSSKLLLRLVRPAVAARAVPLKYKEKKKEEIESLTTLYIINVIMNTPTLRKSVISSVSKHYSDPNTIKKAISDTNLLTGK